MTCGTYVIPALVMSTDQPLIFPSLLHPQIKWINSPTLGGGGLVSEPTGEATVVAHTEPSQVLDLLHVCCPSMASPSLHLHWL